MPDPARVDGVPIAAAESVVADETGQVLTEVVSPHPPPIAVVASSSTFHPTPDFVRDQLKDSYLKEVAFFSELRLIGEPVLVATHRADLCEREASAVIKSASPGQCRDDLLANWPDDTPDLARVRREAFADIFCEQLVRVGKASLRKLAEVSQHPVLIAFTNCALNAPADLAFKDQIPVIREWFSTSPHDVAHFNDSLVTMVEAATLLEVYSRAQERGYLLLNMHFGSVLNSSRFDVWVPSDPVAYAAAVREVMDDHLDRQPPALLAALMTLEGGFATQQSTKLRELDPKKFSSRVSGRHSAKIEASGRDTPGVVSRIKLNLEYEATFDAYCDSPQSGVPLDSLLTQFFVLYRGYSKMTPVTKMPLSAALTLSDAHTAVLASWAQRSYRSELVRWGTVVKEHYDRCGGPCPPFQIETVHAGEWEYSGWYVNGEFQMRDRGRTSLIGAKLGSFPVGNKTFRVAVSTMFLNHFEAGVKAAHGRAKLPM